MLATATGDHGLAAATAQLQLAGEGTNKGADYIGHFGLFNDENAFSSCGGD
jgi:hypothetical protein